MSFNFCLSLIEISIDKDGKCTTQTCDTLYDNSEYEYNECNTLLSIPSIYMDISIASKVIKQECKIKTNAKTSQTAKKSNTKRKGKTKRSYSAKQKLAICDYKRNNGGSLNEIFGNFRIKIKGIINC